MMLTIKKPAPIGKLALSLFLLFWAVIQIYPLIWLALFSLKDNAEIFGGNIAGFPKIPKWENYPDALKQGGVLVYFFNSLLVTGITIVMTVLLSSTTAYAIS
ncbi:MAG: hypothetical protein LBL76_08880, partial [Treponema sp.]|nr:hypothetical protein [Treponema sp.]